MEKRCSKCGKVKPIAEFAKETASPDGLKRWCKTCVKAYNTENREKIAIQRKIWRDAHKDEITAYRRIYREEHREEIATYLKMYQDKHREEIAARQKVYQEGHREEIATYNKMYRDKHQEQFRMYSAQRRVLKAGASGHATIEQIQARWNYYGNKCYICGKDAEATDHVKPLSKGGCNWSANLRPICKCCNSVKSGRWPYDFEKAKREEEMV